MAIVDHIAQVRLLGDPSSSIEPIMISFHTMVDSLRGTEAHFKSSNFESHFGVGEPSDGDLDGVIWQWVDTSRSADANRKANDFVISIETSDGGDPGQPWSPAQVASLIRLTKRLAEVHGIPLRIVDTWNDPLGGLGWHVMFGAPGPWTPVNKSCPGPVRIAQLKEVVFPGLGIPAAPGSGPSVELFAGTIIERGAKGPPVCRVQARLRTLGHSIDDVSGCPFGPQTERAVEAFQAERGLAVDGKVGSNTWQALFAG